jgi:hypothetical protein
MKPKTEEEYLTAKAKKKGEKQGITQVFHPFFAFAVNFLNSLYIRYFNRVRILD